MLKRFLSIFLSLLLLFTTVFVANNRVYAEEEGDGETAEVIEQEAFEQEEEGIPEEEQEGLLQLEEDPPIEEDDPKTDEEDPVLIETLPETIPAKNETENTKATGTAYAVLTDLGELVFFRSAETYEAGADQTVYDLNGVSYTGYVFTKVEIYDSSNKTPFKGNTDIKKIRVAQGQTVMVPIGMQYFANCIELIEVDLHGFSTQNEQYLEMFEGCTKLVTADLSVNNTQVTFINGLFSGCSSLKNVTFFPAPISTAGVNNFNSLFKGCSSLETLDISNLNTAAASSMNDMFSGCTSLKTVTLGEKFVPWWSGAYLPDGYWENAEIDLILKSADLATQYVADPSAYSGTWIKTEGEAYGVLDGSGNLVFYRSFNTYANGSSGPLVDRNGVSHAGTIFSGVEDTPYSYEMPWANYKTGIKHVSAVDPVRPKRTYNWFYGCTNLESFDSTNFDTSKTESMTQMFYDCVNLTNLDLSHFLTSSLTSMCGMFRSCEKLTAIDLGNFDTRNVSNMEALFYMCYALTDLNISSFDTSNVERMAFMFSRCKSMTSLDLSHFNTENVDTMYEMFEDCESLMSITFGDHFDTSSVTSMYGMFYNCQSLTSLDLKGFDISKVGSEGDQNLKEMFWGCKKLAYLDLSSFVTTNITNMRQMFYGCDQLKTVVLGEGWNNWVSNAYLPSGEWINSDLGIKKSEKDLYSQYPGNASTWAGIWTKGPEAFAVLDSSGNLIFVRSNNNYVNGEIDTLVDIRGDSHAGRIFTGVEDNKTDPAWLDYMEEIRTVYAIDEIHPVKMSRWFDGAKNLTNFQKNNIDFSKVTSTFEMFQYCESLTSLDLSNIDISSLENIKWMFALCSNLTDLDLTGFDTSNVVNMSALFYNCSKLSNIVGLEDFNTANVTSMSYMFLGCEKITSLDLRNFNTSKVKDMDAMFQNCRDLYYLNISSFNTSEVVDMDAMFYYCESLTDLDVSKFNTSKVTNMRSMFSGCKSLTSLNLSGFNTSSVLNMEYLFSACEKLTSLDLRSFNTSNVIYMARMFTECYALQELDLSSFDTSKVESMWGIFENNNSLTSVKLGAKWTVWLEDAKLPGGTWKNSKLKLEKTVDELQAEYPANAKKWAGTWTRDFAYAILLDDGDLVFTRSANSYENNTYGTLTDLKKHSYTGTIYSGIEEKYANPDWDRSAIKRVYAVDKIRPLRMYYWFDGCSNLTSFDATNFDTSLCTDMSYMFAYCNSLEELDLHSFDTSNVTDMSCMFACMSSLKNLNIKGFDTLKVQYFGWMFDWDYELTSLDLSSFDTYNATDMSYMFRGCDNLSEIKLGQNWTKWISDDSMLPDNGNWENTQKDLIMSAEDLRDYYPENTSEWAGTWTRRRAYAVLTDAGDLVFFRSNKEYSVGYRYDVESLSGNTYTGYVYTNVENTSRNYPGPSWSGNLSIRKAYAVDEIKPLSTEYWFNECHYLESFDAANINTSHTKDMGAMFEECWSLKSLDLHSLDTSNVTSMASMFYDCNKLETLNISGFNTSNVVYFTYMFFECEKLKELDLSSFETSNAVELYCMFSYCDSLEELDLSSFHTPKLKTGYAGMNDLFEGCSSLKKLDLSNFDTSSLTEMSGVFDYCSALKEIVLGPKWTQWLSSSYLPSGTWTNGVLYKDQYEMYSEYPENAMQWQGTWRLTDPWGDITELADQYMWGSPSNVPTGLWHSEMYHTESYTGKAITKEFRVYDGKKLLKEGTDYTVKYTNNVKVGTATVTITGKGNYQGTMTDTFVISEGSLSAAIVTLNKDCFAYNGKVQKPTVTSVVLNGVKLKANTDYVVEYRDSYYSVIDNPIEVGNYYVMVKGKGSFIGAVPVSYRITNLIPVNTLTISGIKDYAWTGSPIDQPTIVVKDSKKNDSDHDGILVNGTEYYVVCTNNVDAGTATVTVYGDDVTYTGSVSKTFKINPLAFSSKTVTVDHIPASFEYEGHPIEIDTSVVELKYHTTKLTYGSDYTVSYKNNSKAGTATVTFTGTGNYKGSVSKTFKILKAKIIASDVTAASAYAYTKGGVKPLPTVTVNGRKLVLNTDYTVSYKNNSKVGTASITIKGKGNYEGTVTKSFKINPAGTENLSMTAADKVYSGKAAVMKTTVTVTDKNGVKLAAGTDYDKNIIYTYAHAVTLEDGTERFLDDEVEKTDIIPVGTSIKATINLKGNYSGTLDQNFRIIEGDLSKASVTIRTQYYTGMAVVLSSEDIAVKIGSKELKQGVDYEIVSYSNNILKGTASVTIQGIGEYGGSKTVSFKIVQRSMGVVICYYSNGATSGTMKDQLLYKESKLAKNTFKYTGKTFKGWSLTPGGSVVYGDNVTFPFSSYELGSVVKLYAVWN